MNTDVEKIADNFNAELKRRHERDALIKESFLRLKRLYPQIPDSRIVTMVVEDLKRTLSRTVIANRLQYMRLYIPKKYNV